MATAHFSASSVCNLLPHRRYLEGPACLSSSVVTAGENDMWATIRILYHFHGRSHPQCLSAYRKCNFSVFRIKVGFGISHNFF